MFHKFLQLKTIVAIKRLVNKRVKLIRVFQMILKTMIMLKFRKVIYDKMREKPKILFVTSLVSLDAAEMRQYFL